MAGKLRDWITWAKDCFSRSVVWIAMRRNSATGQTPVTGVSINGDLIRLVDSKVSSVGGSQLEVLSV